MTDKTFSLAIGIVVIIWTASMCFISPKDSKTDAIEILHAEAVERGFAEYNKTTGKWQWKEKK